MNEREYKKKKDTLKNFGIVVFPFTVGCKFSLSSGMQWISAASCPAFAAFPSDIQTLS